MKNKNNRKNIIIALGVVIVLIIVAAYALTQNVSFQNSEALFGGQPESGYPAAGYLISFANDNKLATCGTTFLSQTVAISAAHCVLNNSTVYVGQNSFKLQPADNDLATDATINPQWTGKPHADISVIKLSQPIKTIADFGEIGSPLVGCNYTVVGYGVNENSTPGDLKSKLRKSAQICIQETFEDQFYFVGNNSGICYGDSGSPIFETGTNKIVGIVSSIVTSNNGSTTYCSFNNSGVAVRVDSNKDFINSFQDYANTTNQLPKCGQSCQSGQCASGLACSTSNFCKQENSDSCISADGQFCSFTSNVGCGNGFTCVANKCSKNIVSSQSDQAANQLNLGQGAQSVGQLLNLQDPTFILIGVVILLLIIIIFLVIKLARNK